jgi:hypothetical protein
LIPGTSRQSPRDFAKLAINVDAEVNVTTPYKNLLDLNLDTEDYRAFAKSKRGEKNEAMHKLFSDPKHQEMCGVTANQKARIDAWVPDCF